jgi:hypothetical protein
MKVDWLAVNTGLIQLTDFQRFVHSDATVYAIYGSFLVGAWIIPGVKRLRKVADESELERAAVLIDEAPGQAYS